MKAANICLWLAMMLFASANTYSADKNYSFTILVSDEQGKPVSDAEVEFTFYSNEVKPEDSFTIKKTDSRGRAAFKGRAYNLGSIEIKKPGYYPTREKMYVHLESPYENGKHQDYEPKEGVIEMVLKPMSPGIPMYAKSEAKFIPGGADGKELGYDLQVGDFTAPYGSGKIPDIIFRPSLAGTVERKVRWQLEIAFPNEGDGMQKIYSPVGYDAPEDRGSKLRSPTLAPLEGYQSKIHLEYGGGANTARDYIWIFRVRSRLDASGKVASAWYGKMYQSPRVSRDFKMIENKITSAGDGLSFSYHLNPSGSRSLEFDIEHNLLGKLPDDNLPGGP